MLIRPIRCRHNLALQRFPSFDSAHTLSRCSVLQSQQRPLTTRPELRPWRRKSLRGGISFLPERSLATALNDYNTLENLSLDSLQGTGHSLYSPPETPRLWELRPPNPATPLIIGESKPRMARQKINRNGIPGDIDEMLSVFIACLQVGKLDRAAMVLRRMSKNVVASGVDMIELHNQYLQAALDQILANPQSKKAENLHKWYELEIRGNNIEHTPETVALMLKASLTTARGSRLERLVDRYMGMVPGDAGLAVLYMTDILNDKDRAKITDICQTYNLAPGELQSSSIPAEDGSQDDGYHSSEMAGPVTTPTPDVHSTPQKGMGLRALKKTLTLFSEIPEGRDIASLSKEERREIQSRLERDCVDAALDRWREENQNLLKMGLNTSLGTASLNSRLYEWHHDLESRLKQELEKIEISEGAETKSKEDLDRCMYGPFLRQSSPSRLAAVTILSTLSSLAMQGADKGVPMWVVINQLSKVAEEDIRIQLQAEADKNSHKGYKSTMLRTPMGRVFRYPSIRSSEEPTPDMAPENIVSPEQFRDSAWPIAIRTKVGAALLSALIETSKVTVIKDHPETKTLISQSQVAFTRSTQLRKGKKVGMLLPNPTLVELMKREPRGDFLARHLPMVVEPEPWTKFDKGGFLEYPSSLVRIKNHEKEQLIYTQAAIARGDMDQVLKGLDILGKTAWRINRPVLSVILEAWNSGEAIADLPALNPDITIPPEPDSTDDPMQRRIWIKSVKAAQNEKSGLHSVRCFMNFQLEIARAFRDQTFYFPHNVDFRGRAYPIPAYLNHMGADHVRGLMQFAQGRELGPKGLAWLKVHLANVFGYDKASLKDRQAFATDNMENIMESANDPLGRSRWWLKGEDPWQTLATCFELKAALGSPDPSKFVSHLPVHQDGTCNGLQHYAALGGDTWGARQVNLEPGDQPADVYSAVAEMVKKSIAKDLEHGSPFAKALDGKITRKVVKQTVMTNVYGVTFAGARKQVLKQLDALYPHLHVESGVDSVLLASYVATKVFKSLSTMFRGAHDIQYWLGEIGGRVCRALAPEQLERISTGEADHIQSTSKSLVPKPRKSSTDEILDQFRSTLVWTTPLRMPVAQPYRKSTSRVIQTCLQDLTLTAPERSDPVNRRKQLQAFPPNFIHSLDASHMILSALQCDELGLTFAAVHDSFWTHAADIDKMNGVIRDSFIRIHSEDVIGRLASEFEARYRGSIYLATVDQGTAAAKEIAAFRKKHRLSVKNELLLEKERQELLKSSDPKLVKKGKKMVTPASIVEARAAAEDLVESEDMREFALGMIPGEASGLVSSKGATAAEDEAVIADEMESEHEDSDRLESMLGTHHFESKLTSSRASQKQKSTIQIWMPLSFPAIPEKGDFDVTRLKTSDYFFS